MKLLILHTTFYFFLITTAYSQNHMKTDNLPCSIIYKMDVNVKSKNPAKNGPPLWKYALLDICKPKDEIETPQRMVIEIEWQERKFYKELIAVTKIFEKKEDAIAYAQTNSTPIAANEDNPLRVEYLSNKSSFIGVARNAKEGACLVDKERQVYFIEGLEEWTPMFLNKHLSVKGVLEKEEQAEELLNEKGEYSAGSVGMKYIITKAELPKIGVAISLVVVFKKEVEEALAMKIMETTAYPYSEGMDSSKGKSYFYNTGSKFHVLFPTIEEKNEFQALFKAKEEVFEVYQPDWTIQKD